MASEALGGPATLERIDEIPFEPDRKRLVTVHRAGDEVVLFVKGAPEELLPRARWVQMEGRSEALTTDWSQAFAKAATDMADRGLRVWPLRIGLFRREAVLTEAGRIWS